MTPPALAAADAADDAKWLAWKAHAAASDRSTAVVTNWLFALAAVLAFGWLSVQILGR